MSLFNSSASCDGGGCRCWEQSASSDSKASVTSGCELLHCTQKTRRHLLRPTRTQQLNSMERCLTVYPSMHWIARLKSQPSGQVAVVTFCFKASAQQAPATHKARFGCSTLLQFFRLLDRGTCLSLPCNQQRCRAQRWRPYHFAADSEGGSALLSPSTVRRIPSR